MWFTGENGHSRCITSCYTEIKCCVHSEVEIHGLLVGSIIRIGALYFIYQADIKQTDWLIWQTWSAAFRARMASSRNAINPITIDRPHHYVSPPEPDQQQPETVGSGLGRSRTGPVTSVCRDEDVVPGALGPWPPSNDDDDEDVFLPTCSVLDWYPDGAGADGPPQWRCKRRSLLTSEDLQSFLSGDSISAPPGVIAAAAAVGRRPLLTICGLPPELAGVLLDAPIGIDAAFLEAQATGLRARRRRAAGCAATWDYPDLVTGFRRAVCSSWSHLLPVDFAGRAVVRSVSDGEDLAAVFCRASLWTAREADVLLLGERVGGGEGRRSLLRRARRKIAVLVAPQKGKRDESGHAGVMDGEEMPGLEDSIQEAMRVDGDDGLMDVLEEAVYERWLDFLDVLTPRQYPVICDGISLEWQVLKALEANLEMSRTLTRRGRRERTQPTVLVRPDWAGLIRRLQLRVALLPTIPIGSALRHRGSSSSPKRKARDKTPPNNQSPAGVPLPCLPPRYPPTKETPSDENHRALDRVTYLGGVLLPISIVSSILSMNEDFEPGQPLFWVFWAAAVPLTALTVVVIYADKLRRAEVWEEVSGWVGEEGFGEGEKHDEEHGAGVGHGKGGKKMERRERPPPPPAASARLYMQQAGVAPGDVVVDFGERAAYYQTTSALVEPPTPPRPDESGDNHRYGGRPDPNSDDSDEDGGAGDPNLYYSNPSGHGTHPQAWRKKQLGWGGAVRCILHLQKPLNVADGLPVGRRAGMDIL